MNISRLSIPALERQALEDEWRAKLDTALRRHQSAKEELRMLLEGSATGAVLENARLAESHARAQFANVLRIFGDLIIHGKRPEEPQRAAHANGAPRSAM